MARVTIEDSLEKVPNRFALVLLAAKRAKQLMLGAKKLIDRNNKEVVIALREIAAGKVTFAEVDSINKKAEEELRYITNKTLKDIKEKVKDKEEVYTVSIIDDEV